MAGTAAQKSKEYGFLNLERGFLPNVGMAAVVHDGAGIGSNCRVV